MLRVFCRSGDIKRSGHQTIVVLDIKQIEEIELAVALIQGHGRDVSGMLCMTAAAVLPHP